jgi:hypothetical protein
VPARPLRRERVEPARHHGERERVEWLAGSGTTSLLRGCPAAGCAAVALEDYRATAPSLLRALTRDEDYAYVFVANGSGGSSSVVRSPSDGGVASVLSSAGSPAVHAIANDARQVFILGDYMIAIPQDGGFATLVGRGQLQSGDAAAPNALAADDVASSATRSSARACRSGATPRRSTSARARPASAS